MQKKKKMAAKSSKNEMLVFGLCSTFDVWPSNPNNKSCTKCKTSDDQLSNPSDESFPK